MLELQHIGKRFGEREILKDISLSVEKGEIVSILGPSGCGKTTLLNLILGLTDITSGKIIYDGEDLSHVPMEKRGFNIVFQDFALFPNLNAYENIVYGLRNRPNASTKAEVEDLIDLLGLRKHLSQRIAELSGGQKQRVAIARTLVMKPRLLLLDEPLSALDGIIKESIKERIRGIARQFKLTTLIVTHDPEEALTLSDRVLIINNGQIAQFADPQTIIREPADDFIRRFILSQLMVKRTNILKLFSESIPKADSTVDAARAVSASAHRAQAAA
ncbi:MAG TPA: ABC transporter ATP-binding protein [Candidatus Aphodousia gallistercoris]|nr:ABC transporter ATP-binding protein [Candidatus Aphodousia gallistercoris]